MYWAGGAALLARPAVRVHQTVQQQQPTLLLHCLHPATLTQSRPPASSTVLDTLSIHRTPTCGVAACYSADQFGEERSGISPVRIRQLYTLHSCTVQLHRAVSDTL